MRQSGITLVELVWVLVILGGMAVWGASSFRQFQARRAVDAFVTDFTASLRFARSEAVKRGQVVGMCRLNAEGARACGGSGGSWHTGWLVFADLNGNHRLDDDEVVLLHSPAHRAIESALSRVERPIFFLPSGIAPGMQRTVHVTPAAGSARQAGRRIVINSVGTPRIREGLDEGSDR